MPTTEKAEVIEELKQKIEESQICVLTHYIGSTAGQMTDLRAKLREQDVSLRVYKNTLAKRALDELGLSEAVKYIEGPVAWAFSDNPTQPPKILKEFGKEVSHVEMLGGILEKRPVDASVLDSIAELPSQEELIAKTVGTVAAPLRNLLGVLQATQRNFVNVLEQIRKQKEEAGEAA